MADQMQRLIDELMAVLRNEASRYGDLQRILEQEAEAMGMSGRARFEEIQKEKEALVGTLQAFEKKRIDLVDRIAEAGSIDDRPMTVRRLAAYLDEPMQSDLLAAAQRLRAIIGDVQRQHEHNRRMLSHYVDLIKESLKLLMDAVDPCVVYQGPGGHAGGGLCARGGRVIRGTV